MLPPTTTDARPAPHTPPHAASSVDAMGRGERVRTSSLAPSLPAPAPRASSATSRPQTAAAAADCRAGPLRCPRRLAWCPKVAARPKHRSGSPRSSPSSPLRPAAARCAPAKRPTSHANPAAALVREGVRGRSQALDRSLRTPPKCPTRAKEQGCQLAGASSVCGHPGIIRYSSRNNTVETSYCARPYRTAVRTAAL